MYFSKALDYVNFRRTINIFIAFARRKPWKKRAHDSKLIIMLIVIMLVPRDLPQVSPTDTNFKLYAIYGMQQKWWMRAKKRFCMSWKIRLFWCKLHNMLCILLSRVCLKLSLPFYYVSRSFLKLYTGVCSAIFANFWSHWQVLLMVFVELD